MALTIPQVDDVMRDFGFQQTQAAGFFRWYEFPPSRVRREQMLPAFARAMFYEPRSELQTWVVAQRPNLPYLKEDSVYVETVDDVVRAVREIAALRHEIAIKELVRWDDERLAGAPQRLVEAVRAPGKRTRAEDMAVLSDWLISNGVQF